MKLFSKYMNAEYFIYCVYKSCSKITANTMTYWKQNVKEPRIVHYILGVNCTKGEGGEVLGRINEIYFAKRVSLFREAKTRQVFLLLCL